MSARSTHVAALPFPSSQGTQAAIAMMCDALYARGERPELWCYAHGDTTRAPRFTVRRLWDVPRVRSLRSGPSLGKIALDVQLATRLRFTAAEAPLIAHHVEAALAARLAGRRYVFFAHTDLEAELPSYARRVLARPLARSGRALDAHLIRHAQTIAAISPLLAQTIEARWDRAATYVPTPWAPSPLTGVDERARARATLGLRHDDFVWLYAGNLDAYQGWQDVLVALARARTRAPNVVLVIATESSAVAARALASELGVSEALRCTTLADEIARARCHAAADLAVVPRRIPGGLPIKLLDALARNVPVVAYARATAGLPLSSTVAIVTDDAPDALAARAVELAPAATHRAALAASGSAYLREHHSHAKFFAAFDRVRAR